jgi:hypothetical protein
MGPRSSFPDSGTRMALTPWVKKKSASSPRPSGLVFVVMCAQESPAS